MSERIVYVIQEIPGTKFGNPKINIMGASKFGTFKFLLPEDSQIIFSPGPLIYKLRPLLKNFTKDDYLLCTGDPAIIGITCSLVSDITNGKYNLLKSFKLFLNLKIKGPGENIICENSGNRNLNLP